MKGLCGKQTYKEQESLTGFCERTSILHLFLRVCVYKQIEQKLFSRQKQTQDEAQKMRPQKYKTGARFEHTLSV
jgi:hypothetical protein